MRGFWVPKVEKLQKERNIKGLLQALAYKKDAEVRRSAAVALGDIADPRAIEPLIDALNHDDEAKVRHGVSLSLGRFDDSRVLEAYAHALKHETEAEVRRGIFRSLERANDPRVLDAYAYALKHETETKVRRSILRSLGRFDDPRVFEAYAMVAQEDPERELRYEAALALAKVHDPRAVKPLLENAPWHEAINPRLGDPKLVELPKLIKEIGKEAFDPLLETIKFSGNLEESVGICALKAIGLTGDDRAIGELIKIYKKMFHNTLVQHGTITNIDALVLKTIVEVLGEFRSQVAKECFVSALEDSRASFMSREAALALQKLNDLPETISGKVAYYVALDEDERCVEIGPSAIPILGSMLDYSHIQDYPCICRALSSLGGAQAIESLIAGFDHAEGLYGVDYSEKDASSFEAVVQALVEIGEDAVDKLIAAVEAADDNSGLYEKNRMAGAAAALAGMREERAVAPLVRALQYDIGIYFPATTALVQIGIDVALDELAATIRNPPNSWFVIHAAKLIGSLKDIRLTPYIIEALKYADDAEGTASESMVFNVLKDLTGEDFGKDVARWEDWWRTMEQ